MAWLRQLLAVLGAILVIALAAPSAWAHAGHHHAGAAKEASGPPAPAVARVTLPPGSAVVLSATAAETAAPCRPAHHTDGADAGCCHGGACSVSGCGPLALTPSDDPLVPGADAAVTPPRDGPLAAGRGLRPPDHPPKLRI